MSRQLIRELALLYRCEAEHKVSAARVIRQLIADAARPLPDVLPRPPAWVTFEWPSSGEVNYEPYWRGVDRKARY
jgi:hypothetical protein